MDRTPTCTPAKPLLAAFDATGQSRYLDRAEQLARNITLRQAGLADGLIWEHYHADWSVDLDYNKGDKTNIFRPWGYQPGHLAEWAKLLLILDRHAQRLTDPDWLAPRTAQLFDAPMTRAWDNEHGGIVYGFAPDGGICDDDKYFWVESEVFAAAELPARRTGADEYWQWYQRIWDYSWAHFVDHQHGAWYRMLTRDKPEIQRRKIPRWKNRLPHHGRVLRSAQCDTGLSATPASQS